MPDTSITVTGMRASYVLDLPQPYDRARAYPVIMAFRPAGSTADVFRGALGLTALAASAAIVVYPNCLSDAATWDVQRDSLLFDALLAKLEANFCVDQDRVFALGHAAGALFVNGLGCFRGDKLRAIAPLSSAPPPGGCIGKPAAWIAQGIQDPMLGLGRANRDFWVAQNVCNARLSTPVAPTPCVEYAGCDATAPVRYCEYDGDASLPSFAAQGVFDFFQQL
jgi:polyhydroxybutyrate depolymerase